MHLLIWVLLLVLTGKQYSTITTKESSWKKTRGSMGGAEININLMQKIKE
jgi:hypothetical protein